MLRSLEPETVIRYNSNPSTGEKIFGYFFSIIFHPLLLPVYIIAFLLWMHPTAFAGFSESAKNKTFFIVGLNLVFFPLLTVILLKAVGFITSIQLHTKRDRIIPYMACGIFFFWAYTVFRQQPQYPSSIVIFLLGIFLASSAGLIANIYFKVSMHAMGMGGCLGFFLFLFFSQSSLMPWPLAATIVVTGLVCTSRLMISSHKPLDIYAGLIIGLLCQFIAVLFI